MDDTGNRAFKIQIVLASVRDDDRESLEAALSGTPWELILAQNREQAVQSLQQAPVPIVLCDASFDNLPWRVALRGLLRSRRRTCVILLSDDSSLELSTELVRRGGFDVLTRPFQKEEVFPTLVCAYTQCRVHWTPGGPAGGPPGTLTSTS